MNTINIKALSEQVSKLSASVGSGLPDVNAADNGKVLGVVEGSWNKMDAHTGVIDYSTTEQNTGRKWINGKDIYQKTYSLPITWSGLSIDITLEENFNNTPIDYNFVFDGIEDTISKFQINADTLYVSDANKLILYLTRTSESWAGYTHITATVYYTKATVTSKATKKKNH